MMALSHHIGAPWRVRRPTCTSTLTPAALCVVLLGLATGCNGPSGIDGDILDRETFVSVYVDLRMAALDNRAQEIHPIERDSILEAHGVTADDLVAFADAHGDDVRYMARLWSEVEDTINQNLDPDAETDDSGGQTP